MLPLYVASGDNDAPTATLVRSPCRTTTTTACHPELLVGDDHGRRPTGLHRHLRHLPRRHRRCPVRRRWTALRRRPRRWPWAATTTAILATSSSAAARWTAVRRTSSLLNGQLSFLGAGAAAAGDLGYWINGINTGSATCAISVTDAAAGGFPAGPVGADHHQVVPHRRDQLSCTRSNRKMRKTGRRVSFLMDDRTPGAPSGR